MVVGARDESRGGPSHGRDVRLRGKPQSLSRPMSVSGLACSLVCTFHVALKNKKRTGELRYVPGQLVQMEVGDQGEEVQRGGTHKHVAKTNSKKEEAAVAAASSQQPAKTEPTRTELG